MKCSNCGAEISNLNMSWGRKQMWFMIPVMLIGFSPLIMMTCFKGDATKDLQISEVRTRCVGNSLEIVGLITNLGKRQWSSVTVNADFFDSKGVFIDKASEYLRSNIGGNAKEYFKITIPSPPEQVTKEAIQPVVKISGGNTSPF
ncbi:MAG: FxLYD domain-containing protein [Verrucomicrobiota bacterium]